MLPTALLSSLLTTLALTLGDAPSFDMSCLYVEADSGGLLERAEDCALFADGDLVLNPERVKMMDFDADGLTAIAVHTGWRWVRRDGLSVSVLTFDNGPDAFVEGLSRGRWLDGMAYYDRQLNRVVTTPYQWGERFNGGLAEVCSGCIVVPEGEHSVVRGGVWGAIDRTGKLVLPLRADVASLSRELEAARAR